MAPGWGCAALCALPAGTAQGEAVFQDPELSEGPLLLGAASSPWACWRRLKRAADVGTLEGSPAVTNQHGGSVGRQKAFLQLSKAEASSAGQKNDVLQKAKAKQALVSQTSSIPPTQLWPGCWPCCQLMSGSIFPASRHCSHLGAKRCSPSLLRGGIALGKSGL